MTHIQHIGLTCSDIERSKKFYMEIFGLSLLMEREVSGEDIKKIFGVASRVKLAHLMAENTVIELFEFADINDKKMNIPYNIGISHIALFVGDREKFTERLKALKVEVSRIERIDGTFVYFAKDPDGILIELRD